MNTPRRLRIAILLMALALAPLGLLSAEQDTPEVEQHLAKMGIDSDAVERMRGAFAERGVREKQTEAALWGVVKVAYEMKMEGEAFEMDSRVRDYLQKKEITDEQVELIRDFARRIVRAVDEQGAASFEEPIATRQT